jgi:hypothetical protein
MQRQTNVCDKAKGALSVDVTRRKIVEAELDQLIAKWHDRRVVGKGARPALEAWMESDRRHATLLVFLIEHHEREAERYRSAEGAA